jgi:hypothetical protein
MINVLILFQFCSFLFLLFLVFSVCFVQLQRLVTTGALPCSKEEAASLAAIQLRLQECLPSIKLPSSSRFLSHQSCHNNSSNPNQNNNQVGPLFLYFLLISWPVSFLANAPVSLYFIFIFLLMDRVVFCHPCVRLHVQQETTTRLAGTGPEATGGSAQLLHLPAGGGSSSSKDDVVVAAAAASVSSSASGIRSCDDLLFHSASDLASRGRFGGGVTATTATALAVPTRYSLSQQQQQQPNRRPSIFRRCYSSESNAIVVPSWFSSSFGTPSGSTSGAAAAVQQQQQQSAGSTELLAASSSYSLAAVSQQQQPADVCAGNAVLADALVDCLPPYYWEAKHMPRLVKVSLFLFVFLAGQTASWAKK